MLYYWKLLKGKIFDRLLAYHQIRQYFLLSKALYSTALSNVIKELSIVFHSLIITVIILTHGSGHVQIHESSPLTLHVDSGIHVVH